MGIKVTRICAGEYEVRSAQPDIRPGAGVRITHVDGCGWIAAANWDHHLYTDYLPTKRAAVFNAELMLREFFDSEVAA